MLYCIQYLATLRYFELCLISETWQPCLTNLHIQSCAKGHFFSLKFAPDGDGGVRVGWGSLQQEDLLLLLVGGGEGAQWQPGAASVVAGGGGGRVQGIWGRRRRRRCLTFSSTVVKPKKSSL